MPSVIPYSIVAYVLAGQGDLEGAAEAVDRADQLLPRLTEAFWTQMIAMRILLAPVLARLGERAEAAARLDEAAALLAEHPDAGRMHEWHAREAAVLRGGRHAQPSRELTRAASCGCWPPICRCATSGASSTCR